MAVKDARADAIQDLGVRLWGAPSIDDAMATAARSVDHLIDSGLMMLAADHDAAVRPLQDEVERLRELVLFLGTRHTVDFTDAGWNMTHPVTCRFIPGGLKNCPLNASAIYEWDDSPVDELGEYVVDLDYEGSIEVGERVEHAEPPAELWATLRDVLSEVAE